MNRRRVPSPRRVLAVLVLAGLAAPGLTGCGELSPYAVRAGDQSVSAADFDAEMDAFAGNPELQSATQFFSDGTANKRFSAFWASQLATELMAVQIAKDKGIEPTATDRKVGRDRFFATVFGIDLSAIPPDQQAAASQQITAITKGFPAEFLRAEDQRQAYAVALERSLAKGSPKAKAAVRDEYVDSLSERCLDVSKVPAESRAAATKLAAQIRRGAEISDLAANSSDPALAQSGGLVSPCLNGREQGVTPELVRAALDAPLDEPVVISEATGFAVMVVSRPTEADLKELRASLDQVAADDGAQEAYALVQTELGRGSVGVDPRYGTWERRLLSALAPAAVVVADGRPGKAPALGGVPAGAGAAQQP